MAILHLYVRRTGVEAERTMQMMGCQPARRVALFRRKPFQQVNLTATVTSSRLQVGEYRHLFVQYCSQLQLQAGITFLREHHDCQDQGWVGNWGLGELCLQSCNCPYIDT